MRSTSDKPIITIRRATSADAEDIVAVTQIIASERVYSAIDKSWSVAEQRRYLAALSPRETVHVAVGASGRVVGFETLDLWAPTIRSMAHVCQLGTFLLPEWRRCGVGTALFEAALTFARHAGYIKAVIQVRASNLSAQAFYQRLGFHPCGRLTRQVRIDGEDDDEILMELFL